MKQFVIKALLLIGSRSDKINLIGITLIISLSFLIGFIFHINSGLQFLITTTFKFIELSIITINIILS